MRLERIQCSCGTPTGPLEIEKVSACACWPKAAAAARRFLMPQAMQPLVSKRLENGEDIWATAVKAAKVDKPSSGEIGNICADADTAGLTRATRGYEDE